MAMLMYCKKADDRRRKESGIGGQPQPLKGNQTTLFGGFSSIDFQPPYDTIKGKLTLTVYEQRITHTGHGIKVRIEGNFELQTDSRRDSHRKTDNIFQCYPPCDTLLHCGDLLHGQKKLEFKIKLRHGQSWPSPFISSYGSLSYRVVALIKRNQTWEPFAKKLVEFEGYYNLNWLGHVGPLVEKKEDSEPSGIVSTFTVTNPTVVRGESVSLVWKLEAEGATTIPNFERRVSFVRQITYGENVQVDRISSEEKGGSEAELKWTVGVPAKCRATFVDPLLITVYSVRYFIKYEGEVVGGGSVHGTVEVVVGTRRDPWDPNRSQESHRAHPLPVAPSHAAVLSRRDSILSVLSLPPSYSQLPSRSSSLYSLETLPPHYDDLK